MSEPLTQLIVRNATELVTFWFGDNTELINVDVSGCSSLKDIGTGFTNLTNIDLTGCYCLRNIDLSDNSLNFLDLSDCNDTIWNLRCENNQLTSIDLPPELVLVNSHFNLSNNQFESLDLSGFRFSNLNCSNNNLNYLNIRNDKNQYINSLLSE
jgi:uncharacterized protein YjbI with pentapeptide repeats